ncbi:class I SAM-dependent methyltransferase [Salsuginibacillus kocurii]|uniref:class I SAM-dependent methyltransferase n=1 Tax=Salsuginibacillus kocurii TaxID=427078 RepID=UPI0003614229|nr:class I SAM-dependent methyltransferase [Salsuginibacillus kocurii]
MLNVEELYNGLDQMASLIQEATELTYLESIAEAGENFFQQAVVQEALSAEKKQEANELLSTYPFEGAAKEDIRRAFQLAVVKGMKEAVQPHHAMTPDAVALFLSYLVNRFSAGQKRITLLDPAVGTGNLMMALLNQQALQIEPYGAEVDDTLLKVAYTQANLQAHQLQLYHQDSIEQLNAQNVDMVVSDLPVGYYTKDEVAKRFQLSAESSHSLAHHLLIERGIEVLKPGGHLMVLVPNSMFQTEEAKKLHEYVKEKAVILGLLQLPRTMFKDEKHAKSIWILQKKGPNVIQPRQALLAELPSFTREDALADMMKQINNWLKDELNIE